MANKLTTLGQLARVTDAFADKVREKDYEQKENLKALAYREDITMNVLSTDLKDELDGKVTKTEVRDLITESLKKAYVFGGSRAFSELPALTGQNSGIIYNVTDDFTTTNDFVEGAGKTYNAGAEVAVIEVGGTNPVQYKYNVLSNYIDTTKFAARSSFSVVKAAVEDIKMITNDEIQGLINGLDIGGGDRYDVIIKLRNYHTPSVQVAWIKPTTIPESVTVETSEGGTFLIKEEGVEDPNGNWSNSTSFTYPAWDAQYRKKYNEGERIGLRFPDIDGYTKTVRVNEYSKVVVAYDTDPCRKEVVGVGDGESGGMLNIEWVDENNANNTRPTKYSGFSADYGGVDRGRWIGNQFYVDDVIDRGDILLFTVPHVPGYTLTVRDEYVTSHPTVVYTYTGTP